MVRRDASRGRQRIRRLRWSAPPWLLAAILWVGGASVAGGEEMASPSPPTAAAGAPAGGPGTDQCLAAYTEAQRLRKDSKLAAARAKVLICAQDACPEVVKADCVPWLADIERSLPSIVVDARDKAGRDTAAVRVIVDGAVVAERLDGRPIVVDPGPHELRFEHRGASPIVQQIVVQVGVKNRRVEVSFAPPAANRERDRTPPPPERGEPIVGYVVTGVGVLALGSFALFGLMGKSEADEYDETCAPTKTCDPDEVAATERKLLVADVSLVVGIAAVGVGVGLILYDKLSEPEAAAPTASLRLSPTPGGAVGSLGISF